jgi:hypothetical protein
MGAQARLTTLLAATALVLTPALSGCDDNEPGPGPVTPPPPPGPMAPDDPSEGPGRVTPMPAQPSDNDPTPAPERPGMDPHGDRDESEWDFQD